MSEKRVNISSGSSYEKAYGYSRAVKAGNMVFVSGTIGMNYETGELSSDPVEQLKQIIRNMEPYLEKAGSKLSDIVQITTYVKAPEVFLDAVGAELGKIFGDILPVNAALVVDFPVPGVLVEISAVAVVGCGD
jgi:enamine deaminase RidA (YjgF/YER057c/UK114 family)